jgi:hypothetical protein
LSEFFWFNNFINNYFLFKIWDIGES